MVTIIFESHGTTTDNEKHIASGWADVGLSELGIQQSKELGQRYVNDHFDAIFCSDLQRSYKSAEIAFNDWFPIIKDERLKECNYGDLTQHPSEEVDKEKPRRIKEPFPNGESYEQTNERMRTFLQDLLKDYDGKRVMIIGHRATQYGLEHWINHKPLSQIIPAPWKWQPGWEYKLESISMDLKSTYNRIAKDWNRDHENDTWWIAGTDKFTSFLKQGNSILDVGCAGGLKSEYLTKKGFVVTGLDLSDKMIEIAKKRIPLGHFFVKDINEPLGLGVFDGIFAQAVLLHIPKRNIKIVLNNLFNSLKPGGHIYIAVKKANKGQAEEQVIKEKDYGYEYERFFSFYTLEEIKNYLEEFNLGVVYSDITSIGKTEWIQIIAQK